MSNSIRISDETKAELSRSKRDDETWDEFLRRLARGYASVHVSSWSEEEADDAREAVKRSRESFQ